MSLTMLKSHRRILTHLTCIIAFADIATAALTLTDLQPISGFSPSCTSAYGTPIAQCPNAKSFIDSGSTVGCNKECFEALNAASAAIQGACQAAAAFGDTVISHAFMGDLSVFLCGNAFDQDANDVTAQNAATTTPPSSPLISKVTSPTPSPTMVSTSISTPAQPSSTTVTSIATTSSTPQKTSSSTSSSTSTTITTSSSSFSTPSRVVSSAILASTASSASSAEAAKPTRMPKDSTPMNPGYTTDSATTRLHCSSLITVQLVAVMVMSWSLFS